MKYETWVFEAEISRLEKMLPRRMTTQLIRLGGKVLTSFNMNEQHVVYGISLSVDKKEEFERITGYKLKRPQQSRSNVSVGG